MKRIINIGRGEGADILFTNDLISRRHATIKILPFGKMEIRDYSKNGTYVNGIRLDVNKPYPVTRKDVVSFARVSQLDWNDVPDPLKPYRIGTYIILAVIIALLSYGLVSRMNIIGGNNEVPQQNEPDPKPNPKPEPKPDESTGNSSKVEIPNLFPKEEKAPTPDKGKNGKNNGGADKENKKEDNPKEKKQPTPPDKENDNPSFYLM